MDPNSAKVSPRAQLQATLARLQARRAAQNTPSDQSEGPSEAPANDDAARGSDAPQYDVEPDILLDGPILDRVVSLAFVANKKDMWCKTETGAFESFLPRFLMHERGEKDGAGVLQGALRNPAGCRRKAEEVASHDLAMLDYDKNVGVAEVEKRIRELGLFAIIWTTFSHAPEDPHCRALFLRERPFSFVLHGRTHEERVTEFKKQYAGLAELIGLPHDGQCKDVSRLMYLPRIAPDADITHHVIRVIDGRMLTDADMPCKPEKAAGDREQRRHKGAGNNEGAQGQWRDNIREGIELHDSLLRLALSRANEGVSAEEIEATLEDLMHESARQETDHASWQERLADIPRIVREAVSKVEAEAAAEGKEKADLKAEIDAEIGALDETPARPERLTAGRAALIEKIGRLQCSPGDQKMYADRICKKLGVKFVREVTGEIRAATQAARDAGRDKDASVEDNIPRPIVDKLDDYDDNVLKVKEAFHAANEKDPRVFTREEGGQVRIENHDGRMIVNEMTGDRARWTTELARCGRYQISTQRGGSKLVAPFDDMIIAMIGADDLKLSVLDRVIRTPVFAADGSLRTQPGYDKALKCYLDPNCDVPPLPDVITDEHIGTALRCLTEPLIDFPFSDKFDGADVEVQYVDGEVDADNYRVPNIKRGRSSRWHVLAMILQPFVRPMIGGPCPNYHIDKPEAGTGASLLVDVANIVWTGEAVTAFDLASDSTETGKVITAAVRAGVPCLFFDNIKTQNVDSGPLALLSTTGKWGGRVLGVSELVMLPFNGIIIYAGNSIDFNHELIRRNIPIRIDANLPDPAADRNESSFKRNEDDLRAWVRDHRPEVIWSILVLVKNWLQKGRPKCSNTLASFSGYSHVVGGILEATGIESGVFLGNLASYRAGKNQRKRGRDALVQALWEKAQKNKDQKLTYSDVESIVFDSFGLCFDIDINVEGKNERSKKSILGKYIGKELVGHTFNVKLSSDKIIKVKFVKPGEDPVCYEFLEVGGTV